MKTPSTHIGRKRQLRNRWSVKASDVAARSLITIGGIGTIVAVSGVFLYLAWVVAPLFFPARVENPSSVATPWRAPPLHLAVDEHQVLGWTLSKEGKLRVFRLDTGETLGEQTIGDEKARLTSAAFAQGTDAIALGFSNGAVRLGKITFEARFVEEDALPDAQRNLESGELVSYQGGVLQRAQGELKLHTVEVKLREPMKIGNSSVELVDLVERGRLRVLAAYTADGGLTVRRAREKQNLLTGETTSNTSQAELPFEPREGAPPDHLLLTGLGDNVYAIWNDGFLRRYSIRNLKNAVVAEELDLLPGRDGTKITAVEFLLGKSTLLVGDSSGMTRAWFRVAREGSGSRQTSGRERRAGGVSPLAGSLATSATSGAGGDGFELVAAHELPGPGAAVASLAHSPRDRVAAIGYANGEMRAYYVTTSDQLVQTQVADGAPVRRLLIAPKEDAIYAVADDRLWRADFEPGHPAASFTALFRPIWYESYPGGPDYVWQSGGGGEAAEPKLSMWPLVFGTLKATFYSMLFGVPIALLAAIYTSEFLSTRARSKVKPAIELMASLPSVVLGFLAALVFAPMIEKIFPSVLAAFVMVPLAFLIGAYLWQLLPYGLALRLQRWRLPLIACFLPLGFLAAYAVGPLVERWLFGGDLTQWLDGGGNAAGGWMLLLLPLCAAGVAVFVGAVVNPRLRRKTHEASRGQVAFLALLKFLLAAGAAVGLAWLASLLFAQIGWDARGGFIGEYDQRNSLVIGFVMGFAIIPIIFTIADDALSTVPRHLRSGSLGAGATQWQTAVRIVIPTAMSGLFSAVMIGLGRAVGETMIVLMATGSTPITEWNVFNGFRTLSATLATEMPEAARGGTHFRTLFLAALLLFLLTFIVNTIAEIVRLRFRKRAYQL